MTETYLGWALMVGVALGAALVWFVLARLPRRSEDVSPDERAEEARWISRVIESRGGVAPAELVDEVLELHGAYLEGPPIEARQVAWDDPDDRPLAAAQPAVEPARSAARTGGSEVGEEDRRPV